MLTFLRGFVVVITSLQRAFHYFCQAHIQHAALTAPLHTAALKEQLDKQSISLGLICPIKSVKASLHDVLTWSDGTGKVLEATFICSEPDAGNLDLYLFHSEHLIHFH